jgi:hypothetical protein
VRALGGEHGSNHGDPDDQTGALQREIDQAVQINRHQAESPAGANRPKRTRRSDSPY